MSGLAEEARQLLERIGSVWGYTTQELDGAQVVTVEHLEDAHESLAAVTDVADRLADALDASVGQVVQLGQELERALAANQAGGYETMRYLALADAARGHVKDDPECSHPHCGELAAAIAVLDTEPEAAQPEANPTDDTEKARLVGQVVELREALKRADALLADPSGSPFHAINLARAEISIGLSAAGTEPPIEPGLCGELEPGTADKFTREACVWKKGHPGSNHSWSILFSGPAAGTEAEQAREPLREAAYACVGRIDSMLGEGPEVLPMLTPGIVLRQARSVLLALLGQEEPDERR